MMKAAEKYFTPHPFIYYTKLVVRMKKIAGASRRKKEGKHESERERERESIVPRIYNF